MKREIENTTWDARWVATIILSTGKTLVTKSDWKPSHWYEHRGARDVTIRAARQTAQHAMKTYGVGVDVIELHEEERVVRRVTETMITTTLDSTHYIPEE